MANQLEIRRLLEEVQKIRLQVLPLRSMFALRHLRSCFRHILRNGWITIPKMDS